MKIELVFLGTSQAIPTTKRNHTAILIRYKNENILIDCGEGTQRQFRKAKINPCKITRLLITHWHGDHILGIPGLLQTLALNGYNKTLEIYGPKGTKRFMDLMYRLFIYRKKIKIKVKEVSSEKIIETPDFYITSAQMKHGAPCLAYSFVEKDKLRIDKNKLKKIKIQEPRLIGQLTKGKPIKINKRIIKPNQLTYKQKGKKIAVILDTTPNPNIKIAKNAEILISEATYSDKQKDLAKEYKHLTASQAAQIAKKIKAKKLILTHISQRYDNKENTLLKEAKKIFPNTEMASDLEKIEIK